MIMVRGATTLKENTKEAIEDAMLELWDVLMHANASVFAPEDITMVLFSATKDVDAAYPGSFVRLQRGLTEAAILHFNEMAVQGSLPLCLRVLIQAEGDRAQKATPVYLRGAKKLRPDLNPAALEDDWSDFLNAQRAAQAEGVGF
ncbi:hypothetical protein ABB02_01481 [Clostridiaceae bacterium JG1575]|nr:hypothetical protein ABB02_01481 [Clostridiaceae bacterium JG1575]